MERSKMDFIPIITMKNRDIYDKPNGNKLDLEKIIQEDLKNQERIYVLDLDGIKRNKPNLCLYQKISYLKKLIVDIGPREMGDIVDAVISGVENIVIRKERWKNFDISAIKKVTENNILQKIDLDKPVYSDQPDGYILMENRKKIEESLKYRNYVKKISSNKTVYAYEKNPDNIHYWDGLNIDSLIIDLKNKDRFTKK
ncbi:MAG: hypothetical protein V5A68_05475 [Candidatus Thermoplasmatota archaeon]